jgi:hypothetical protein
VSSYLDFSLDGDVDIDEEEEEEGEPEEVSARSPAEETEKPVSYPSSPARDETNLEEVEEIAAVEVTLLDSVCAPLGDALVEMAAHPTVAVSSTVPRIIDNTTRMLADQYTEPKALAERISKLPDIWRASLLRHLEEAEADVSATAFANAIAAATIGPSKSPMAAAGTAGSPLGAASPLATPCRAHRLATVKRTQGLNTSSGFTSGRWPTLDTVVPSSTVVGEANVQALESPPMF